MNKQMKKKSLIKMRIITEGNNILEKISCKKRKEKIFDFFRFDTEKNV